MKLNKISLAIVAAVAAPMMANAGVTVSPLLLGYHYTDEAREDQGSYFGNAGYPGAVRNANDTNNGIAKESDLYTGAALGIELTPSSQFQVEYGISNADGQIGDTVVADVEQEFLTGNFLIGTDQFTGYRENSFRPYVLLGAGQTKMKIENQNAYNSVPAGTEILETTDTIGNLGLGAMFRVNDSVSLRGEARAIHNFESDWWEGMALAGLEVVLGGHLGPKVIAPPPVTPITPQPKPPVQPKPEQPTVVEPPVVIIKDADSDNDGVIDRLDACPNTPITKVVDERGCPKKVILDDELKMELRVFFDNDKSNIKDQYKPEIAKVAEKMREYPNSTASIEGHASKTGPSARYNQRLSEARAIAVKSMLTNQFGVAPNRLTTVGYGYTRPIASNDTEEGRAMNRRVYAIITGNKAMTVDQTKDMNVQ